jgi:hypothetical protein
LSRSIDRIVAIAFIALRRYTAAQPVRSAHGLSKKGQSTDDLQHMKRAAHHKGGVGGVDAADATGVVFLTRSQPRS